jgi:hypothetical protein
MRPGDARLTFAGAMMPRLMWTRRHEGGDAAFDSSTGLIDASVLRE